MKDLAKELLGKPSLEDAAGFFVRIKTAGWSDPPDETGELEGTFDAPVEEVLDLMQSSVKHLIELNVGYEVLLEVARGPGKEALRGVCGYGAADALRSFVKRMATLGGPVHLPEVEMPPATTDPVGIAKMLIRKEQELIASLEELKIAVGSAPMLSMVDATSKRSQERIDSLWSAVPRETESPVLSYDAPPEEEEESIVEEETPEEGVAGKLASAPTKEELKQKGKWRAISGLSAKAEKGKGTRGERYGQLAGSAGGALGGAALGRRYIGGKAGTIAGLAGGYLVGGKAGKELGKELDIKKAASMMKQAYRMGAALGALGGGAAGYGLAPEEHKVLGTVGGALAGAGLGAGAQHLLGRGLRGAGKQLAEEAAPPPVTPGAAVADEARALRRDEQARAAQEWADANLARQQEARIAANPKLEGTGGGKPSAGDLEAAKKLEDVDSEAEIAERVAANPTIQKLKAMREKVKQQGEDIAALNQESSGVTNTMAQQGEQVNELVARARGLAAEVAPKTPGGKPQLQVIPGRAAERSRSKLSSAAGRFKAALLKMAEGDMAGQGMAAPSAAPPDQEAIAYLAAEQAGRQAQEANESAHYKQRFQQAVMENQGLQQMMMQTQQQLQAVQQQAQMAGQQIQQATQQAVQANDEALRQTQQAANMRMGMQQMRAQMLQVASQEPDAIATQMQQEQAQAQAQQLASELQPPPEAGMEGPPPVPATPQKAEEEAVQAEKAQQEAQQQAMQAEQAAQGAQMKMGSAWDYAAPAVGALLGAGGSIQQTMQGEEGLAKRREAIQALEGKGGFANAMRMAKAKAGLAGAEMAVSNPIGSALMGAAGGGAIGGAFRGAQMGKKTQSLLKDIANSRGELARLAK